MTDILLTTLNARYIHSAFGLRYLKANLGELEPRCEVHEFTLERRPADIAEQILARSPRIIGLGVYIWNAEQSRQLAATLKTLAPDIPLVLGGPEVSHEWETQPLVATADYLVTGQADLEFAGLCRQLLSGERPPERVIAASPPDLARLKMPYRLYSDQDIAQRVIYVEASRGCPFKCEFCLSALDRTAWPFPLERFLQEMEQLYRRGVRHFKFVDRTFNLDPEKSARILDFFLEKSDPKLFLHFEMVPDRLPEALRERIQRFAPGTLQFEIGIQSFNPDVQQRISRRQDTERTRDNLLWLRQQTHAHLHADLIFGLPGENIESIADGFDRLWALNPHEIQLGILKRLRGSPIIRHTREFDLKFNPNPPYDLLASRELDFPLMQRLARFARYWDLLANSGRFPNSLPLLLADSPFKRFMQFSDWLLATTGQVHRIALPRLFSLLQQALLEQFKYPAETATAALEKDFGLSGLKGRTPFSALEKTRKSRSGTPDRRQQQHQK